MGKPYSDDLRERVVAAIEAGHSRVKVAELYNMALSTVGGFIKRKRETGSVSPDKFGGYKTFTLEPHIDRVKELVAEQPDSTLAELQVRLAKEKVKVDDARSLIAETCRKLLDGLEVVVDPPHGFGAVDADRLDLDADLVRTGGRNLDFDELENLRSSSLCEFDRA